MGGRVITMIMYITWEQSNIHYMGTESMGGRVITMIMYITREQRAWEVG